MASGGHMGPPLRSQPLQNAFYQLAHIEGFFYVFLLRKHFTIRGKYRAISHIHHIENGDLSRFFLALQEVCHFKATHSGHIKVYQDQVGMLLCGLAQGILPIGGGEQSTMGLGQ